MMMGYSTLYILLWVMPAFIHTAQELVTLRVSPVVTAECDQQVTLHCNVSSSRNDLIIRHLSWMQNEKTLCDSDGKITDDHSNALSGFRCVYEQGKLSLVFTKVQPLETGAAVMYMCKLRSSLGVAQEYTKVELQECCGNVEVAVTPKGPTCTFTGVHPDGDVHWFHGSTKLAEDSVRTNTSKSVDGGGWLTVTSSLEKKDYKEPYNCSLWNPVSGRYIKSRLAKNLLEHSRSGAGGKGPLWTLLCFSLLSAFSVK